MANEPMSAEDLRLKLAQLKRAGYLKGLEAAARVAEDAGAEQIARAIRALRKS